MNYFYILRLYLYPIVVFEHLTSKSTLLTKVNTNNEETTQRVSLRVLAFDFYTARN